MRKKITGAAALIILSLSFANFKAGVYAGRIELDNGGIASTSVFPSFTQYIPQFSRFSLTGLTELQSSNSGVNLGPLSGPPPTVFVNQLSDYGITASNFGDVGSLIQISAFLTTSNMITPIGSIRAFVVDPVTGVKTFLPNSGSITGNTGTTLILFSLSAFGPLPAGVTPDFYFGVTSSVGFSPTGGQLFTPSSLTIASNAPSAVPEPSTLLLFIAGLGGLKIGWSRRRKP